MNHVALDDEQLKTLSWAICNKPDASITEMLEEIHRLKYTNKQPKSKGYPFI